MVPFLDSPPTRLGRRYHHAGQALSLRRSEQARPIQTTSRRPSSSPATSKASTWSRSSRKGIFSYCGVKVKIDTDRHLGPERNLVRADGEPVGHVTTGEYGSQMLSLGGVHHLTGGGQEGGPRHLRHSACPVQPRAGRSCDSRSRARRSSCRPVRRRSSMTSRKNVCGSVAGRPRSVCSPRNGRVSSTRSSSWMTILQASCRNIRPVR